MIMIIKFIFISVILVLSSVFLTRLVKSGMLFSTVINDVFVAKY